MGAHKLATYDRLRRGRSRVVGAAIDGDMVSTVVIDAAIDLRGVQRVVCGDVVLAEVFPVADVDHALDYFAVEFAARDFSAVGELTQLLYERRVDRRVTLIAPIASPHLADWHETAWRDGVLRVPGPTATAELRSGGTVPMRVDWVESFTASLAARQPTALRAASIAAYGAHLAAARAAMAQHPVMGWLATHQRPVLDR